jgi:cyclic pyranopterin phosphate synthase
MPQEVFGPDYEFLRKSEWLCFPELDDLVEVFTKLGVSRIRLTSGEPMLHPSLKKYIYRLKHGHKINDIAITTNGLRLAVRGRGLKEAGLDWIAVSLDVLDPQVAGKMNGCGIRWTPIRKRSKCSTSAGELCA